MTIFNKMAQIDRKTASKLLKVSIRTVDRYIRAKKLAIENKNGRIWLNKKDVIKLRDLRDSRHRMDTVDNEMSIDSVVSTGQRVSMDNVHIMSTRSGAESAEEGVITTGTRANEVSAPDVYKKLFEELQVELKKQQERLEGANYRVGQLEALLKDAIPLPDHNRLLLAERSDKQKLEADFASLAQESEYLAKQLKEEKFTRKVFLIFLFIIMLLQPLWFVLSLWR
jgi:Skp family chaperone for outer membrane proteins